MAKSGSLLEQEPPPCVCDTFHQLLAVGRWFFPGTPVSSIRKLISSPSFHRLDMTLAVAEAVNINKPKPSCDGVFTPEQDNDKTTTRQKLNLWIPILCLSHQICRTWCEKDNRNAQVQHLSCCCLVVVLLWCENTIRKVPPCRWSMQWSMTA